MRSFCLFVQPAYWQFWPIFVGFRKYEYSDLRRIYLGPIVIQWYVIPKAA